MKALGKNLIDNIRMAVNFLFRLRNSVSILHFSPPYLPLAPWLIIRNRRSRISQQVPIYGHGNGLIGKTSEHGVLHINLSYILVP